MTTLGITGSTGHLGGLVATALASQHPVLIVRDAARAPQLDGTTVRAASYDDADGARAALSGVDVLFMVSAGESEDRRAVHRTFIAAAAAAGVRHIVYTSFLGAAVDADFTLGRDHADAEQAIRESGMQWTFLRDNFYSEMVPLFAGEDGVVRGPAGDGLFSPVARADVADVASAVLTDPDAHRSAIYELTGPEAFTMADAAARVSAVIGRTLTFHDETLAEAYASRRAFTSEQWQLDAWVSTYTAIRHGEVARVSGDVERLTGHPARTIEQAVA